MRAIPVPYTLHRLPWFSRVPIDSKVTCLAQKGATDNSLTESITGSTPASLRNRRKWSKCPMGSWRRHRKRVRESDLVGSEGYVSDREQITGRDETSCIWLVTDVCLAASCLRLGLFSQAVFYRLPFCQFHYLLLLNLLQARSASYTPAYVLTLLLSLSRWVVAVSLSHRLSTVNVRAWSLVNRRGPVTSRGNGAQPTLVTAQYRSGDADGGLPSTKPKSA